MVNKGFTLRSLRGWKLLEYAIIAPPAPAEYTLFTLLKRVERADGPELNKEKMNRRSHTFRVFIYPTVALERQLFEA